MHPKMSPTAQCSAINRDQQEFLEAVLVQLCTQPSSVIESETIEIKNWCSDEKQLGDKASEVSVCLANLKGGLILLGIENEDYKRQKFSPCPHRNVSAEWIVRRIQDNTVPPVEVSAFNASEAIQRITGNTTANCFALFVAKSRHVGGHQTIGGLSKIRSGKECRPYYVAAQDDRSKAPVAGAAVSDLAITSVEWGMSQHEKKFGVSKSSWESSTDFLLKLGFIEQYLAEGEFLPHYRVTLAALLLFGKESVLQREFPSSETILITPLETRHLRVNIVESFRQLCGSRSSLLPSILTSVPTKCIKELLVNAFVHRSYRHNSPIVIHATESELRIESPGGLSSGLSADSLIYCTPTYRNFLLAEGARYLGLCDKIGKGIDEVYDGVLQNGLGFPVFENRQDQFSACISISGCKEFKEFLGRRSQSLNKLDEIIVLRYLYDREKASFNELCTVMQRGHQFCHRVLSEMFQKNMVEPLSSLNLEWRLFPVLRTDIERIFEQDQYNFGFSDLYGDER